MKVDAQAAIEVIQGLGRSPKALLTLGKGTLCSRCWRGTMRWRRRSVVEYEQPRQLAESHGLETKRVLQSRCVFLNKYRWYYCCR